VRGDAIRKVNEVVVDRRGVAYDADLPPIERRGRQQALGPELYAHGRDYSTRSTDGAVELAHPFARPVACV
jgi:hypothetical protein